MHVYVCLRGHQKANIGTVRRNEMYFPIYKNPQLLLFVKKLNSMIFLYSSLWWNNIIFKNEKIYIYELLNCSRSPDFYVVFW
jgi:hypothetical protein